ncbi:DUF397 domain-containing protein [Kitasatospora sp. McL0602]|uniref:DUF397 domain-containing protein n=1 Tax=Kitasatospora sp. McL0602 TaxID=3439530 RepID=UPI003F8B1642
MTDLYRPDVEVAGPFTALCGGGDNSSGSMEDCMSVAALAGGIGYAVGDTKLGDASPQLRYTKAELVNGAHQILAMFGEGTPAA